MVNLSAELNFCYNFWDQVLFRESYLLVNFAKKPLAVLRSSILAPPPLKPQPEVSIGLDLDWTGSGLQYDKFCCFWVGSGL